MRIVYDSFEGRYSDNPRALYEWLLPRISAEHTWLADPRHAHAFPPEARLVPYGSAECVAALESADLVVGNTHIDLEWVKPAGASYLQTWHGTPLKRVHRDVHWAPEGRLDRLDRDVSRWDYLLSPNAPSTPRLQGAFGFRGEVLEYGYPRNDLLRSPRAETERARVRAALGLREDETAVLYTPTWRDQHYFDPARPSVQLALDLAEFLRRLGGRSRLLPRLHYLVEARGVPLREPGVVDVSYYPDVAELYLAADVLVTDYSSAMFDFAITGKPMVFYTYDLDAFRTVVRGFYFDLEPIAPGPMVSTADALIDVLSDLPSVQETYAERYRPFQETFCHLEDGHATERLGRLVRQLQAQLGLEAPLAPV